MAARSDVLEAMHTPDFVLCTPDGTLWSRQHYLGGLANGSISYLRFEPVTPIEVLLETHLAVLRYRSEIEISVGGGSAGHLACWHLDVYQREASHGVADGPKPPTPSSAERSAFGGIGYPPSARTL